jgi:hypothetical protein
MPYTSVDIETLKKNVDAARYMPKMIESIVGIPDSYAADNIFGQDRVLTNALSWFDNEHIETISLVKFSTQLGKYEPVGSGTIKAAEYEPKPLKLIKTYDAETLHKLSVIMAKSPTQITAGCLKTFMLHEKKLFINQAHQFFADGVITYPLLDAQGIVVNDGDSINYKTYYLSGNSATIYSYTKSDTTLVTTWDGSGNTAQMIYASLLKLIKQGQTNTNKKHFMNMSDIVVVASDTAFAKLAPLIVSTLPANQNWIRMDGFDYILGFGSSAIRVVNDNMTYYTWTKSAGAGDWSATSAVAIAADTIRIIDNKKGNFKTINLKFLDQENVKGSGSAPYTIVTDVPAPGEILNVYYRSKTLLWGDPSAFMIVDVLE